MLTLKLLGGLALENGDGPLSGRATQRRRLALLALLAGAPSRTLSRDKLIGYLWPESETDQARHLLSVALHEIRKGLGEEVLLSQGDEVCLNPERVAVDAEEFERALAAGEAERAVALYTGPFLDGFFLSDSVEFERWVDGERARLEQRFRHALELLAGARDAAGDRLGAVEAWRRLAALEPYNSRVATGLMRALAAAGDRAAALQHARIHEVMLREEYGAEPDAEVVALAARLREEPETPTAPPAPTGPQWSVIDPQPVPEISPSPDRMPDPSPSRDFGPGSQPADDRQPETDDRRPRRRLTWTAALAAVVLVAGFAVAAARGWIPLSSRATASIAVLPFTDVSPAGDNEYFSDGLTEEITNALSGVEGVEVAARTSAFAFKGRGVDVREVGQRLNVGSVLEGSVRKAGDRLRITARLVDVRSGYDLWSATYERPADDVFRVQDEIARAVAAELRGELVGRGQRLISARTPDLEAYNLYLRGRFHWYQRTGEGFRQAIAAFQRAVELDSTYALAYAGLGDVYSLLSSYDYGVLPPHEGMPRAKAALQRALRLDPAAAEAHAALGNVHMGYDWDWAAAEREFLRAMELNPGYATALHWYALLLTATGRQAEGLAAVRRARELEPLSLVMSTGMARVLYYNRQFEGAEAEYRRALEMDSSFVTAHLGLGLVLMQRGDAEDATAEYQTALRLLGRPQPTVQALLAHAYAARGRTAEARQLLARLEAEAGHRFVAPEYLALVHLGLGDHDRALDRLEQAYQNRSSALTFLAVEPLLDPLRRHPRFQALRRRVGV